MDSSNQILFIQVLSLPYHCSCMLQDLRLIPAASCHPLFVCLELKVKKNLYKTMTKKNELVSVQFSLSSPASGWV